MFRFSFYAFLVCIFLQTFNANAEQNNAVSVIPVINEKNQQISISKNGLSAIFKMRLRKWKDGSPISVFVLEDEHPLHKKFCKEILFIFSHQVRRAWNKLVFSGSGQAPVTVDSKEAMIDMIKSTPGAIGYLPSSDLSDGIKQMEIQ